MTMRHHGFTMIEIVMVVASLAILSYMMISGASRSQEESKLDLTYTDQAVFAADFETVLQKVGVLAIDPKTDPDTKKGVIVEYLLNIQTNYLHSYLDFDTLKPSENTFEINTKDSIDPWGMPYKLIYCTSKHAGQTVGDTMLISGGPNMEIEHEHYYQSAAGSPGTLDFADDKVLLIDVKESTFGE